MQYTCYAPSPTPIIYLNRAKLNTSFVSFVGAEFLVDISAIIVCRDIITICIAIVILQLHAKSFLLMGKKCGVEMALHKMLNNLCETATPQIIRLRQQHHK